MQEHFADVEVQKWGCVALGSLALKEEVRERMGQERSIKVVCGVMREFPEDLQVQSWGCWAFFVSTTSLWCEGPHHAAALCALCGSLSKVRVLIVFSLVEPTELQLFGNSPDVFCGCW